MRQNAAKENSLSEAKDRAQLTATTAMSVVHVTLLRSLLQGGEANNQYYFVLLVLIGIVLASQVVVGILSLLVSHMKAHFVMHSEGSCSSVWSHFDCFRHGSARNRIANNDARTSAQSRETVVNQKHQANVVIDSDWHSHRRRTYRNVMMTEGEVEIMRRHDHLSAALMESNITSVEAHIQSDYLRRQLQRLHAEHGQTVQDLSTASGTVEVEIYECTQRIEQYAEKLRLNKVIHGQYDMVHDAAEDIRKNHALKRVSFWQHNMNYLLYFVFICNTFITGLGIVGSTSANNTELC